MGQDLGELCGLGIVHVGDTDALPVAQHGQQHLDALVLQRFHVSLITAVFEQVGHLVIQEERRLYHSVHRPLVDVRGKQLHDTGKGFAVGEHVISGIERVGVVGLDIDGHHGRIAVSTGLGNCALIHRRLLGLLAREHHRSTQEKGCKNFKITFHSRF